MSNICTAITNNPIQTVRLAQTENFLLQINYERNHATKQDLDLKSAEHAAYKSYQCKEFGRVC